MVVCVFHLQWNRVIHLWNWNQFHLSGETVIDLGFTGETVKVWNNYVKHKMGKENCRWWQEWSTSTMPCSLNSGIWFHFQFHCETKTSGDKWITLLVLRYGDSYIISIFSLCQMHWLPSARTCGQCVWVCENVNLVVHMWISLWGCWTHNEFWTDHILHLEINFCLVKLSSDGDFVWRDMKVKVSSSGGPSVRC